MKPAYPAAARAANSNAEIPCSALGKGLPLISVLMRVARGLWPTKAALELSSRTMVSERMCRYWLAERCSISADALADLLRSEEGLKFLEAVIGDARPRWWTDFRWSVGLAQTMREQRDLAKRVQAMQERFADDE